MVDTFLTALAAASSFCSEMSAGTVLLGLAVGGAAGACVWAFTGAASTRPVAARVAAQKPIIDLMLALLGCGISGGRRPRDRPPSRSVRAGAAEGSRLSHRSSSRD